MRIRNAVTRAYVSGATENIGMDDQGSEGPGSFREPLRGAQWL